MPEGPSIVILREEAAGFAGKIVKEVVAGNSRLDLTRMRGRRVLALRSWGKRAMPDALACDVLLDQDVFAGCGNIIKNEVLHRIRVHPENTVGALSPRKRGELVEQAREYSFDFYEWKKAHVLRKHWQIHARTHCPRDGTRLSYRRNWAAGNAAPSGANVASGSIADGNQSPMIRKPKMKLAFVTWFTVPARFIRTTVSCWKNATACASVRP